MDSIPNLMTPTEAGRIVGRDPRTIAGWVRSDSVPGMGVEIAGRVFIRRRVLEELVNGDGGRPSTRLAQRVTA